MQRDGEYRGRAVDSPIVFCRWNDKAKTNATRTHSRTTTTIATDRPADKYREGRGRSPWP